MGFTTHVNLRRLGGGLIATLPKELVKSEGLRAGERVAVTITRPREAFEALAGASPGLGKSSRSWRRCPDRY